LSKQIFFASDWNVLRLNSNDYLMMMELAYENKIYTQVLHNGHIAIELILKSAISKEKKEHPEGHELLKLVMTKINGTPVFSELNNDPRIQVYFNQLYTAWSMHYRYESRVVSPAETLDYLMSFREAYKWIRIKYEL